MIGRGPNKAKPVFDTKTRKEYPSMYQAGKALAASFGLDPKSQLVWYRIVARAPDRFQTKNAHGHWVELDDPSVVGYTPVVA